MQVNEESCRRRVYHWSMISKKNLFKILNLQPIKLLSSKDTPNFLAFKNCSIAGFSRLLFMAMSQCIKQNHGIYMLGEVLKIPRNKRWVLWQPHCNGYTKDNGKGCLCLLGNIKMEYYAGQASLVISGRESGTVL